KRACGRSRDRAGESRWHRMAEQRPSPQLCDLPTSAMPGRGSRRAGNGQLAADALSQLSRACPRTRRRRLVCDRAVASCERCADQTHPGPPMKKRNGEITAGLYFMDIGGTSRGAQSEIIEIRTGIKTDGTQ